MSAIHRESLFYPGAKNWTGWRIPDELQQTFLLLWIEMFHERTLDSWQVRTCNARSLLLELKDAAAYAETHERFAHHIKPLIEETFYSAKRDNVAITACPFLERTINDAQKNLKELGTTCDVALQHLTDYRERIVNELRELLSSGHAKEKSKLAKLALSLGTELAASGHSIERLRESSRFLRESPGRSFIERFTSLVERCGVKELEYRCEFRVRSPLSSFVGKFPGLTLKTLPTTPSHEEKGFYAQVGSKESVVELTVKAADAYEARRKGELLLGRAAASRGAPKNSITSS